MPFGALLATLLLAGAACIQESADEPVAESQKSSHPFVLITVDTLRADYVGVYGATEVQTPAFDALAEDGVRFTTTVAEVPLTLPAHSSLFTASYPPQTGVRDNLGYRLSESHLTLAEVLSERGYSTAAFPAAYVLASRWGLDQGFDFYDDWFEEAGTRQDSASVERNGKQVTEAALEWIRRSRDEPLFVWIHLFDPHDPYEPPSPFDSLYAQNPYAGEVAFADEMVGRILHELKKLKLYDESLIVLAGDHGESLGEHGEATHGYFLYDATLKVPLILKPPDSEIFQDLSREVSEVVQLVDVAPTALQVLGIPVPDRFQGRGMLGAILGKSDLSSRPAYAETFYPRQFGWSELRSWRTASHKYVLAPREELYDLRTDPGEKENVLEGQTALANQYQNQLLSFLDRYAETQSTEEAAVGLSPEEIEQFQSLGYIGTPNSGMSRLELDLPDPKDRLRSYQQISRAMALIARERFAEAIPVLNRLREENIPQVSILLGQSFLRIGRFNQAQRILEPVVSKNSSDLYPRFYLAQSYFFQNSRPRARKHFEILVDQHADFFPAHHYLGLIQADEGELDQAIKTFSRAVEIREDAEAYQMLGLLYTQTQDLPKAARALEKAVRLEPENPIAHLYLGNAYLRLGEQARGRAEYERAFELDPSLRERLPK